MKSTFKIATILLILVGSFSCRKEHITTLPPMTQTGANTFGCNIIDESLNIEPFVAQRGYGYFGVSYSSATYSRISKQLKIRAFGRSSNIEIHAFFPADGCVRTHGIFYSDYSLYYREFDSGDICFTKFDTINKVVSGTFSGRTKLYMTGDNSGNPDSVVYLSEGRFDIELEIRNN